MRVKLTGYTVFIEDNAKAFGYIPQWDFLGADDALSMDEDAWMEISNKLPKSMDEIAEFAGRNCYQSWERPNPVTATNEGYLRNILNQKHYSVLEHANATITADGISVALLGQLTRHRHFSYSVLSQRYVDKNGSKIVTHPNLKDLLQESVYPDNYEYPYPVEELLQDSLDAALENYNLLYDKMIEKGLSRKQAREAARMVLPQGIETCIVLTGNMRAFRDFLGKRNDDSADAEIHEFAKEVLRILKGVAPNSFQDMEV